MASEGLGTLENISNDRLVLKGIQAQPYKSWWFTNNTSIAFDIFEQNSKSQRNTIPLILSKKALLFLVNLLGSVIRMVHHSLIHVPSHLILPKTTRVKKVLKVHHQSIMFPYLLVHQILPVDAVKEWMRLNFFYVFLTSAQSAATPKVF